MLNNQEQNFFYAYNAKNEVETLHAAGFSMNSINSICNSIVKIRVKGFAGTGFFIKTKIKGINMPFLYTNYHVIEQQYVDHKETIYISYGPKNKETKLSIKLDKNKRFIKCFPEPIDVTVIHILPNDNISEDKYLISDSSYLKEGYESYIGKDCMLAGYPKNNIDKGDIFLCSGKILAIHGFEVNHDLDTKEGDSGSPICLINNKSVIAIHKKGNKLLNMNYGTLIGYIQELLENDNGNDNRIKAINNNYVNFANNNNNTNDNICFFTFKEYYEEFYQFHKKIANDYVNQSEYNFNGAYQLLSKYLHVYNCKLQKNKNEFLKSLNEFKDIYDKDNFKKIVFDSDFIYDINELLLSNDKVLLNKLIYFISGFMLALNKCGESLKCEYKINSKLYHRRKMNYKELIKLKENISKIICFKIFLCDIAPLGHLQGFLYQKLIDSKEFIETTYLNILDYNDKYDCKIYINYCFQESWKANCISVSKGKLQMPEKIFNLFSFFKVKDVKIDENDKSAEIILDSIGKKEILEKKIWREYKPYYNSLENIFEAIECKN